MSRIDDALLRAERRLHRQIAALGRLSPWLHARLHPLLEPRLWYLRVPAGGLLVLGGVLWFLPVLGLWMLPLGLLVLAVDLPLLRGPVSGSVIRLRRRLRGWRRRLAARR
jgi:hypothetical protein